KLAHAPLHLTRVRWASKLFNDASDQATLSGSARGRSCSVCIRLRCRDDARTGDAVLQFDVVPVTRSSRTGLLQNYDSDARSVCATLVRTRRFYLSPCIRSA